MASSPIGVLQAPRQDPQLEVVAPVWSAVKNPDDAADSGCIEQEVSMRSTRISFLAAVTAAAGLIGFIGVFADWYSLAYQFSGTKVVLDFYGTVDGTGAIAVAASLGALMFGCAYMLLQDHDIRRITALLMAISSIVLLIASAIGFTRVDEAIGPNPLLPGVTGTARFTATVAFGLGVSFVAGVIATVASVLLVTRRESGTEGEDDVTSTPAEERSPSLTG
jgi:hypothetical protein